MTNEGSMCELAHRRHNISAEPFLPTSLKELKQRGWNNVDIILFSGDAYVDHPSFGAAVIGRVLEREGYRVAIVPQPNWRDDLRDFKKLGKPRLFFGVSGGAMDSMVNHYTAARRLRSNDAYTPNGAFGMRPDYAVSVYSKILKQLYPDVPVVIGGIEASLRRVTHYDYWQDKLLPSVLISSNADYLIYGMGERPIVDLASFIALHRDQRGNVASLRQVAWRGDDINVLQEDANETIYLNSYEQCLSDKRAFSDNFNVIETNANAYYPKRLIEPYKKGFIAVNPPYQPCTEQEIDACYDLPFTKLPHPRYKDKFIPAYEMIKFSINTHRGCFGGCNFCTIAAHQGRFIQSRSEKSILQEVERLRLLPDFNGNISDLGGPTANMYGMHGYDLSLCKKCFRKSCLQPVMCNNLNHSHAKIIEMYKKVDNIEGIRHSYIGSGIRYDLFLNSKGFLADSRNDTSTKISKEYLKTLIINHTSGRLKIAPEHTEESVLRLMNKPPFTYFVRLKKEFDDVVSSNNLKTKLVPYFISSHPGCTMDDMIHLSKNKFLKGVYMDQVQDFTPTPMTASSVIYYTQHDIKDWKSVFVEKDPVKKKQQKSFFFNKY